MILRGKRPLFLVPKKRNYFERGLKHRIIKTTIILIVSITKSLTVTKSIIAIFEMITNAIIIMESAKIIGVYWLPIIVPIL